MMIAGYTSSSAISLAAFGQQAAAPAAETVASGVKIESVWDIALKGGPVMIPIALCSLVALTVVIERLLSLQRRRVLPPEFLPGLKAVLGDTRDRQKALDFCALHSSPLASIFSAGIRKLGEPAEVVRRQIQEAGQREVFKLRKYLRSLSIIVSITPLLGLLGTITGMIRCFQTVAASAEALGRTELLARGIYEAMITTAAGLSVAIPVILAHHAISAKVDRLVFEMDTVTIDFLEKLGESGTEEAKGPLATSRSTVEPSDVLEAAA